MAFQVVNANGGYAQRVRQTVGHAGADQKGTGQARAFGIGDCVDLIQRPPAGGEHLAGQGQQAPDVVAGGKLRHHAAVFGMHVDLECRAWASSPLAYPCSGAGSSNRATPVSSQDVSIPKTSMSPRDQHVTLSPSPELTGAGSCGRVAASCYNARLTNFLPLRAAWLQGARERQERYGAMPTVRVKENEPFEVAMRRFKRTVEKTGLLTELRAREFYEKPTAERKRKRAAAVKRHFKRLRSQQLPPRMY